MTNTTEAPTTPATFAVGDVVVAGGGSDYTWTFTVTHRTAKFVTLTDHLTGDTYRVGVKVDRDGEWALPFGTYSMAPVIRAGRS